MSNKIIAGLSAPLTQNSHALESSRDSGFDLSSSVGEIIDNSLEANASWIRVQTVENETGSAIVKMAFADNGEGIPLDHLAHVLSLGYSSRYNSREGMGRFGMGLKLASLGQSRSVEIYTRPLGSDSIYCTSLDLDAVGSGDQVELTVQETASFPAEFANLMMDPSSQEPFKSGTLVVWGDVDRLPNGEQDQTIKHSKRSYAETLEVRRAKLIKFVARAYRKFLAEGRIIELDGTIVELYDPTFQLPSPRIVREFGENLVGSIVAETTEQVNGHDIHIRVTLAPLATRRVSGKGARQFEHLYINEDDNQAVSMVRQGREIYFALIPKMYPSDSKSTDPDRFIGVEVSFPAALDELFQVRNVKRGAEPVDQLRRTIREFITQPILEARKRIRDDWALVKVQEQTQEAGPAAKGHELALHAVEKSKDVTPTSPSRPAASAEEVQETLFEMAEDHGIDPTDPANEEVMESIKDQFHQRALTIMDRGWPGNDMFEIRHVGDKVVLKLNHRHPFIKEVYDAVKESAAKDPWELTGDETKRLLTRVDFALDVLFMAYAHAESASHRDPEAAYSGLRSQWGTLAAAFVREGIADL